LSRAALEGARRAGPGRVVRPPGPMGARRGLPDAAGRGRGGRGGGGRVRAGVGAHRPARIATRAARALDALHRPQPGARHAAAPAPLVAQGGPVGAGTCGRAERPGAGAGAARGGSPGLAAASSGSRGARDATRGAAPGGAAGVLRRPDPQRDRPAHGPAAGHGEDEAADRAAEAGGGVATPEGLDGMTDWLGMAAPPKIPRPELKERVLARALAPRRRSWRLAAAAGLVLLAGGGAYRSYRIVTTLRLERDRLARAVLSLQDTLALVRSPDAKVVWVPVATGGR